MAGICYQRYKERGLWFEIKCLEDCIAIKKELGKDAKFEEGLLKSYKQYKESDYAVSIR